MDSVAPTKRIPPGFSASKKCR
jgi:hypothetical protein